MTLSSHRLPLTFDARLMQADLRNIAPGEWVPHFNKGYYEGDWSGVALRAVEGAHTKLYPDPAATGPYVDTEALARCPYVKEVLAAFECPLLSVRFLRLAAGSRIREHKDYNLCYEDGEIRIHVPVVTSPEVEFYLAGERLLLGEGESWYINFNLPHRVENRGREDRVHLVIDCVVNDWVRSMLPAG